MGPAYLPFATGTVFSTPLARLRVVGILEGVSFLVLLGVAMPLKYLAGLPFGPFVLDARLRREAVA